MSTQLAIIINDEQWLKYDRNKRLPGKQRLFLDKMDEDMDLGITLGGNQISRPDQEQRCQYVAMELVNALINKQEALVSATCAYLVHRVPSLSRIVANEDGEEVAMQLLYDN